MTEAAVTSLESARYARYSQPGDDTPRRRQARIADEALLEEFGLHQQARGLKASTIRRRAYSLAGWLAFLEGRLLSEATPDDVEAFMRRLKTQQTRHSYRGDINGFYDWATKRRGFAQNPVVFTYPPRVPQREPSPIEPAEVRRLLDTTTGDLRLMVMLAAMAGLRVAEIGRMHREDLRADGYLTVRQGKGSKDRVVPASDQLRAEIEPRPPGPLWGAELSGVAVSGRIKRQMDALGITGRAHDLRHTFATEVAARAGGDLLTVQRMLGHSSPQTTMRYVRWRPGGSAYVQDLYEEPER